jgi:hypothetical protein
MSSLDDLRMKPEERVAALEALVDLQRYQIELLHRQLEGYAKDLGVLLSVNAELNDDGAEKVSAKECRALVSPGNDDAG